MLVIFGASGDLTSRKLIPALYELSCDGLLPDKFCVLGVSRSPKTDDAFREELREAAGKFTHKFDANKWATFAKQVHYHSADGGSIDVPLEKAPWGDEFGQVKDKFGVNWLVNIAGSSAPS